MFLPREHGATAMLLTPMICAAILAREWRWIELATLVAAVAALAAKDPAVVLARQKFVWKQQRPETAVAAKWFAGWLLVLAICGVFLGLTWPPVAIAAMGAGAAVFSILAVWMNVRNRQRSTLFQIVSAAALTSGSVAMALSATGRIPEWCWWLWGATAAQAAAGILVVHARLDARIASRMNKAAPAGSRRSALVAVAALAVVGVAAAVMRNGWISAALLVAAAGYAYDLRGQLDAEELRVPLKAVGQRALALSSLFAVLVIAGLW